VRHSFGGVDVVDDCVHRTLDDGVLCANDGDGVDSLTALVDRVDGRLLIIGWSQGAGDTTAPTPAGAVVVWPTLVEPPAHAGRARRPGP
jgi:hypothetical protein